MKNDADIPPDRLFIFSMHPQEGKNVRGLLWTHPASPLDFFIKYQKRSAAYIKSFWFLS